MLKKELLAPAGDVEAGYAALYYGADAVYLGLQKFSARATAENFSETQLNEFVGYAHSLKRKVYVAVNTLVQQHELSDLLATLDICLRCQVDGVIIQDLGVARIVRESYPQLEMHASTQMAVHNKEGALALQKLGFKRVVVARELSLAEIKEIAAIPGLETEAFIHGALCYSYSGMCLFSAMEYGKSANRGKCLYPCRALFNGEKGNKHYFSMKDMALEEDVLKLPIMSLKIEGRKKTALYVAAVTDYYRKILDGKGADAHNADNIKQIFSRPWCKFHFKGKDKNIVDRDFVGHRGLEVGMVSAVSKDKFSFKPTHKIARYDGLQLDVPGLEKPFGFSLQQLKVNGKNVFVAKAGEMAEILLPKSHPEICKGMKVYLASASEVKGAYDYCKPRPGSFRQKEGIEVQVEILRDKISAGCKGKSVCVAGQWEKAQNPEQVRAAVEKAFAKCGETPWALNGLELKNPHELFVPVSVLNDLRRQLYEALPVETAHGVLPKTAPIYQPKTYGQWLIKTDNPSCLEKIDLHDFAEVLLQIDETSACNDWANIPQHKIRICLPDVCRNMALMKQKIDELWAKGFRKWEISNYWGLEALPSKGIDLSFDSRLYVMNQQAMCEAKNIGCSRVSLNVEDTLQNWQDLLKNAVLPCVLPIYQNPVLFTSAVCIRENSCKDCKREDKRLHLEAQGQVYEGISHNCLTRLWSVKPFYALSALKQLQAPYLRVDFVYQPYLAEEAAEIWQKIKNKAEINNSSEANLQKDKVF